MMNFGMDFVKYTPAPYLKMSPMLLNNTGIFDEMIAGLNVTTAIIVLSVYTAVMLAISIFVFGKRQIKN